MSSYRLRLLHLYPDLLNLYGDSGNVLALRRRCEWRGIAVDVAPVHVGETADLDAADLVFVGGGPDTAQELVAEDLAARGAAVRARVERGLVVLAVCAGYQLLGRSFTTAAGVVLPGVGVFDAETRGGATRLVGDIVVDTSIGHAPWLRPQRENALLVGFENHSGITRLGPDAVPLGRVVSGFGNDATGRHEGAVHRHAIGTYLHGSLLPKNPWLADCLIAQALRSRYGTEPRLAPLDDALEYQAQAKAILRSDT